MGEWNSKVHAIACRIVLGLPLVGCAEPEEGPPAVKTCLDEGLTPTAVPDVPLAFANEHLEIYVEPSEFMCAGTFEELSRFVGHVEASLELEPARPIPLYVVENPGDWCTDIVSGCLTRDGVAFSRPMSIHHELAHGVACRLRYLAPAVLSEGLAVSFEPTPIDPSGTDPREYSEIERGNFGMHYGPAGHFSRWLLEAIGPEDYKTLYTTATYEDGIWSAIEAAYGPTAASDYLQDAPFEWAQHRQCEDLPTLEPDGEGWTWTGRLDCDDISTQGPYMRRSYASQPFDLLSMYQSVLIDVPAPGEYRVYSTPAPPVFSLMTEPCLDGDLATEEDAKAYRPRSVFFNLQYGTMNIPTAGTWRLDVLHDYEGEPVDFELTIVPHTP